MNPIQSTLPTTVRLGAFLFGVIAVVAAILPLLQAASTVIA